MGLDGGLLCLDFANTVSWRGSPHPNDRLQTTDDLLAWSIYVGLLAPEVVESLHRAYQKNKRSANIVLKQARTLRESIYRIFSAISVGRTPEAIDITTVRTVFAEAVLHANLVNMGNNYIWQLPDQARDLRVIGRSIAISAVELMTSDEIGRVRKCQNNECSFLFLDRTRNGSRLWCTSDICGNRVRVRRHYDKSRESK